MRCVPLSLFSGNGERFSPFGMVSHHAWRKRDYGTPCRFRFSLRPFRNLIRHSFAQLHGYYVSQLSVHCIHQMMFTHLNARTRLFFDAVFRLGENSPVTLPCKHSRISYFTFSNTSLVLIPGFSFSSPFPVCFFCPPQLV